MMSGNEELYNALVLLKDECKGTNGCNNCNIKKILHGNCTTSLIPSDWEIKKPRRFTDTDILWTLAAKAAGATEIERNGFRHVYAYTDSKKGYLEGVVFPDSAFEEIEDGETVLIDDILKEGNMVEDKE